MSGLSNGMKLMPIEEHQADVRKSPEMLKRRRNVKWKRIEAATSGRTASLWTCLVNSNTDGSNPE